jgi:Fe-S-cluster formation regulator IscX/YfhJ
LKYCIDQAKRKVIVHLEPCDRLHYTNVPVARALIKWNNERRIGKRYLTFEMPENDPRASYTVQMESELTDLDEIKQIQRDAQTWLSDEVSRLKSMQQDLEMIREVSGYAHA